MGQPDSAPVALSPKAFAAASGLSKSTVDRYLKSGRLAKCQPGGRNCRILIPVTELSRLVDPASDSSEPLPLDDSGSSSSSSAESQSARPSKLSGPRPKCTR